MDDLDALYAIHSDEGVVRYLYNDARTREEVHELLGRKIGGAKLHREGDGLSAAVVLRGTGELVGDVSLLWSSGFIARASSGSPSTRRTTAMLTGEWADLTQQ